MTMKSPVKHENDVIHCELAHKEGRLPSESICLWQSKTCVPEQLQLFFENSLIKGTLVLFYNKYPLCIETSLVKYICLHSKKRIINVLGLVHSATFI